MEIIVEDIHSYIQDITKAPKAMALVREICRARPEGYQYMSSFRKGQWDGYVSLMVSPTRFPTGLLRFVANRLIEAGFTLSYRMVSNYIKYDEAVIQPDMLQGVTLRDYQLHAIKRLLEKTRGVAKMATNSGKTEVMAGVIKALNIPKTIVIVSSKELLYQTAQRFETRLGIPVGLIGDGHWDMKKVTVAMIQTLYSRLKDPLLDNQLVMIDECHHASSDRSLEVLSLIHGPYRFGFSGTPLKHDLLQDMKLIAYTGRVVVEVTNEQLIEGGYSAQPVVHITTVTSDAEMYEADYQKAYADLVIDNDYRNALIAEQAMNASGVVLVLVTQLRHGKILQELIPSSVFVTGQDEIRYRESVLSLMRVAKKGVFIATTIFDEGIDVPAVDNIILACAGKSHVKLLQRIGRGLRKKENGNNVLHVYDFIDDTNKYLLRHSERRIDTYVQEGFRTELRT